ncbi:Hypothetical protein PHPALM_10172 [Phytophthora palmivora]|uniref:FYVE-type domain-containing protein n=1 Tax=Phytophthora palmivora TaxID=4796 RepID=A0A2P4Y5E5_9STRA|nr:Hypothetical protein PHPALM_10172 [Phytophthora palmivora]
MLSVMHHEDVVDCALLETIEAPTENDPFHFLGIKYFARKTGMKYRDSVYVEFTGYTETTRGERLGFHVIHSVELSEFPFLTARNSVRTLQSVRYLYRQQSEDVVEVFMQGNLDDAQFSLSTLMACAEAKRLTQMWRVQQARNRRQDHRKQQARRASTALECTMCRQKKKRFGGASLAACELCANVICTRCRSDKKVFEMNANQILGKFRRLAACKSCILEANRALSQPDEPRLLIVMSEHLELDHEGSRSRRRCGTSSVGSSASRSRSASSCLSASSEECSPAPRLRPRGANESVTSSASTVSSKSYRECPIVPVSPMGMRAHGHQLVYTLNDQQMELQQQRANTIKASTERAYRIQQVGCDREAQQQLTLREHHRIPLQPSETVQNRQQALAPRSHRDYALRRVASTGSAFSSSYRGEYSSSTQNDLFARMVELNRVAESTYNTTQQNGVYLSQQMRSRRKT